MASLASLTSLRFIIHGDSKSRLMDAFRFGKFVPIFSHVDRPLFVHKFKRLTWSLGSAANDGRINSPPNDSGSGTRLVKTIQVIQFKIVARLKELRKNLPAKLFSFLVGFYCATAFATVIGQTGDWDVLSAALTVAVVEGIGALMYKASIPIMDNIRTIFLNLACDASFLDEDRSGGETRHERHAAIFSALLLQSLQEVNWIITLVSLFSIFIIRAYVYPPLNSAACSRFSSHGCSTSEKWLLPTPARELTDSELFSLVVIRDLLNLSPNISCTPKIVFLFLTPSALPPFEKLWDKFLQANWRKL